MTMHCTVLDASLRRWRCIVSSWLRCQLHQPLLII